MRKTQVSFITKKLRALLDTRNYKPVRIKQDPDPTQNTTDNSYGEMSKNPSTIYLNSKGIRRSTSFKKNEQQLKSNSNDKNNSPSIMLNSCVETGLDNENSPQKSHFPMNKTAVNWKIQKAVPKQEIDMRRTKCPSKCRDRPGENRFEPVQVIHIKPSVQKYIAAITDSIGNNEDAYIKYIARKKRPRPAQTNINRTYNNGKLRERTDVKAFDWNGIHFEVNVGNEASMDSGRTMKKKIAKEMNLISYNFIAEERIETASNCEKGRSRNNKTSMNFYSKKEKVGKINSPSTTEENSFDGDSKSINSSINGVTNSANNRTFDENHPKKSFKKHSDNNKWPPPLTPITNHSNCLILN